MEYHLCNYLVSSQWNAQVFFWEKLFDGRFVDGRGGLSLYNWSHSNIFYHKLLVVALQIIALNKFNHTHCCWFYCCLGGWTQHIHRVPLWANSARKRKPQLFLLSSKLYRNHDLRLIKNTFEIRTELLGFKHLLKV